MAPEDLIPGAPVWAKMKGYPPWPAKIVDHPSDFKAPKKHKANYVMFFGTGDFAWISNKNIIHHSESVLNEAKNRKKSTTAYQNGIDALISYSKSYKKVKQPKMVKREIVENNVTKPKIKVVKVLNSVSKKYDRKVSSQSLHKKAKVLNKRLVNDFNGNNSNYHPPSKLQKIESASSSRNMCVYDLSVPIEQNIAVIKNPKHVKPSSKNFGFIGLGMMGKQIVKNLLESGHKITVWNKTASKCDIFVGMGAKRANYPSDLALTCDIIFSCVSDPDASKAVLFGEHGVLNGLEHAREVKFPASKGFVEFTTIDPFTSRKAAEAMQMKDAVYLEAPISGTAQDAEEGNLLILTAGDQKLFSDCETCFHAIARNAYYVSCNVGDASKLNLTTSMISGTMCGIIAEAMVFMERSKLQKAHFLECLQYGPLCCKSFLEKAQRMDNLDFHKGTALKYVQKDISLALLMANDYGQKMPFSAAANEIYKHGRLRNYSNEDMSAVYKVVKY